MKRILAAPYDGPTTLGIDTSRWQDRDGDVHTVDVDFEQARRDGGIRFAVVRSGDGKDTDPVAARYLRAAHEAGLLVGAYHYFRAIRGGVAQAEIALDVIRTAGVPIGFVAIDIEGHPGKWNADGKRTRDAEGAWWSKDGEGVTTQRVIAEAAAFVQHLQAAGHRVVVYGGQALHWYFAQEGAPEWLFRLPLWVASYAAGRAPSVPALPSGAEAWPPWSIWQFTGNGVVPGVRGDVDVNRFRGDEDALAAWWLGTGEGATSPIHNARAKVLAVALELKTSHPEKAARLVEVAEGLLDG